MSANKVSSINSYHTLNTNTIEDNNNKEDNDGNIFSENLCSDIDDFGSMHEDAEICDIIRAHVFAKQKKNKKRYNTSENLNSNTKKSIKENILNENTNFDQNDENYIKNISPKRNNKIKIKKNYEYLMAKNKNRNRSGYL